MPSGFASPMQYNAYCTGPKMYFMGQAWPRRFFPSSSRPKLFVGPILQIESFELLDVQVPIQLAMYCAGHSF